MQTDTMRHHTPGPWHVHARFNGKDGILDETDTLVAEAYNIDTQTQGANARLIAAAPDLLATARALDEHMMRGGPMHQGHPLHMRLRAAIAQAEERDPHAAAP